MSYFQTNKSIVAASGSSFVINYATNVTEQFSEVIDVGMFDDFSMVVTWAVANSGSATLDVTILVEYYDVGTATWYPSNATDTYASVDTADSGSLPLNPNSGAAIPVGTRIRVSLLPTARATASTEEATFTIGFIGKGQI